MQRTKIVLALAALLLAGLAATPAHAAAYQVVVHAENPVRTISADRLSRLFLKKLTRWDDGSEVEPVDQSSGAAVRSTFSDEVHGKNVASIESYWQRMIFSGRATPPPELGGDAEVLAFVRANPGAIGYVSVGTATGAGIAVVTVDD